MAEAVASVEKAYLLRAVSKAPDNTVNAGDNNPR
jgi:hypothetical protein